jgi:hypothetical protein
VALRGPGTGTITRRDAAPEWVAPRRIASPAAAAVMSHRLRTLPLVLVLAAACSDGNGPGDDAGSPIFAVRTQSATQSLWRYDGTQARRVTPDSVRFIIDLARAPDGRLAWISLRPAANNAMFTLVETAANGATLRRVDLAPIGPGSTRPRDLAYSPDGTRLAWRHSRDAITDSLFVLDAGATTPRGRASRRLLLGTTEAPLPASPLRWTPAGRLVFGEPGTLVALDPAAGEAQTLLGTTDWIQDYDFALDGRLAVVRRVPGGGTARILTQRAGGGALIQIPGSAESDPIAVRWHPDGRRVGTTGIDSLFAQGLWRRIAIPQFRTNDGSAPVVRVPGVWVAELHGFTPDGRLVVTGATPTAALIFQHDVYVASTAGTAVNLSNTPEADEGLVAIAR